MISSKALGHVPVVDGLRAFAALWVILLHASQTAMFDFAASWFFGWIYLGRYAVAIFIVISGYCLGAPVMRRDLMLTRGVRGFYRRRAIRILPAYYAALALSLILIATVIGSKSGTIWDTSLPATWQGVLSHVLLVHNLIGGEAHRINYPMWSIAVECQLYLVFPLLILGWHKIGGVVTTAGSIVVGYALYKLLKDTPLAGATIHFLGLFAVGIAASGISGLDRPLWTAMRSKVPWMPVAHFYLAALLALHFFAPRLCRYWEVMDLTFGIGAALIMISAATGGNHGIVRILGLPWIATTGTFAYSIYLLHAPLLEIIHRLLVGKIAPDGGWAYLILILVAVPVILVVSYGFYLIFERPVLNRSSTASTVLAPKAASEVA